MSGSGQPKGINKARLSVTKYIAQIPRVLVPEAVQLPLKLPSGDQSAVEPPGPIPNPEVKRRSANGSETIGLVRVGRRQVYARLQAIGAGLFFCGRHRDLTDQAESRERVPAVSAGFIPSTAGWDSRDTLLNQNSQFPGVRAKGITSRMFAIPVTNISIRSNPRPKPACGTLPYLRRSLYQL